MTSATLKSPETQEPAFGSVIAGSTTRVPTRTLLGRGVDKIRVLSESRFLEIVKRLVEDSIERRARSVPAPPVRSEAEIAAELKATREQQEETLRGEVQTNWETLRSEHQGRLDTIEDRLGRLTGAFDSIQGTLARLEKVSTEPRTSPRPVTRDVRRQMQRSAFRDASSATA